jgi:hypothetical protein
MTKESSVESQCYTFEQEGRKEPDGSEQIDRWMDR